MMRPRSRHCRPLHRRRRGYALIVFALIFFCLMALGALVIDLGIARMTQRQMQTAVDSAALEGLRGRDAIIDLARRQNASDMVSYVFDDDFSLGANQYQFGAGPRLNLSDGIALTPEFTASQLITLPDPGPPVYDPLLQINLDNNDQNGDMVAGIYDKNATDHHEQADYSRSDFAPASGDAPPGETNAFLVRLRRSNEPFLTPDGARSNEGPLPYLFGRGSLLASAAKGNGITVRATAIAQAARAKAVGKRPETPPEVDALEIPGGLPILLPASSWSNAVATVATGQTTFQLAGTANPGYILDSNPADGMGRGMSIGELVTNFVPATPTFVADMLAAAAQRSDPVGGSPAPFGFVGLYSDLGRTGEIWIVGFGAATLSSTMNGFVVSAVTPSHFVGWRNASPTPTAVLNSSLPSSLFEVHGSIEPALYAPALVR